MRPSSQQAAHAVVLLAAVATTPCCCEEIRFSGGRASVHESQWPTPVGAKSVLFVAVDDMRPMMKLAYNFSYAHTPNMDRLAREGLTFTRAYCNYAYCSPSRNSFMCNYSDKTP